MAVLGLASANALALRLLAPDALAQLLSADPPPRRVRLAACVSLVAWFTVLTLGRLVGYF